MNRKTLFLALESHPFLDRLFKRLSKNEIQLALEFLDSTATLGKNEFIPAMNSLFLDIKDRPKRWKEITELLNCANSALPN